MLLKKLFKCFSSKNVSTKHKEVCLSINGAQSVRLEKGTIEFKNYFKQIPAPFRIYADFECNLKSVESYGEFYSKEFQDNITCSFAYKLICVDDEFTKPMVVFRGENSPFKFIIAILKEYCKKVMKKRFNKNLIMIEEEEKFQSSNSCCICEKLSDDEDEKLKEYCPVTGGKFRDADHWGCNIFN